MRTRDLLNALLAVGCLATPSAAAQDTQGGSVKKFHTMPIQRLPPRAFPALPPAIARALESRGCTVPQTWLYGEPGNELYKKPHNVIHGSFRRNGQVDWAVLCSQNDSSAILIFWGGRASNPGVLARERDGSWTQDVDGKGNLGYSRLLEVGSPRRILSHNPGMKPRNGGVPLHDGVEDYFVEKGSIIYYFEGGRWSSLDGAD